MYLKKLKVLIMKEGKRVSFFFFFVCRRNKRKKIEKKFSLEGLGPDLLGDLEGAVDVVVAVEEDLGLDDRAQAGGCFDELKRERERREES